MAKSPLAAWAKIITEAFPLAGGLDLVTPALQLPAGMLIDSVNFEPDINGGYRRIYGMERFDGRTRPSDGNYWNMACTLTGAVVAGNTVTGATSGATGVVLRVNGTTELILTKVTGTFVVESITVAAVNKGSTTSVSQNGALTPILHATYKALAATNYRADIAAVPGSGAVRGVWDYSGNRYAFRDNIGATACLMYRATAAGWVQVTFGREIQFTARSATVTMTIAAPGVVSWTAHSLPANTPVIFSTTGALPTGIVAGTTYYVLAPAANTFTVAATAGGAAITTSGTQSGVHTCTATSGQVSENDLVVGAISGATATVKRALLRTGTWTTAPVGTLVFDTVSGVFTSGEALQVGGVHKLNAGTADTAIALQPGGRFEFTNNNFSGTTTNFRMFAADGVNFVGEFDGTRWVPIRTGIAGDNPGYLAVWKNMLVIGISSSVQVSGIGQPYSWTALTGAAELALGSACTGLLPQLGDANNGALFIGTTLQTMVLYGNSSADFKLVVQSPDVGVQPHTMQNIGFAYFLDTRGVTQLNSSRNFGNFELGVISRAIQPLIDARRGLAVSSCVIRGTNQFRLFFNDGTCILLYFEANEKVQAIGGQLQPMQVGAIMFLDYGSTRYFNTCVSVVDSTGTERVFAGGSDGFVYELERGTSMDGSNITAHMLTAFNSSKSPRTRKRYKRTILQVTAQNTAQVQLGYDLNYSGSDIMAGTPVAQTAIGGGGYWDMVGLLWEAGNWDAPYVTDYEIDTPGDGRNFSLLILGDTDMDQPYTIHSAIVHYSPGRAER